MSNSKKEDGVLRESMTDIALRWNVTDPTKTIEIAQYSGYLDTNTVPMLTTYEGLAKVLSIPDPELRSKNGPSFLIGPCRGRRRAANIPEAHLGVVDADKSILEDHTLIDGAPPPFQVHQALKAWNISHIIYTTHSHGGSKGCRYRLVITCYIADRHQLKALVTYIVELLQLHAQLPIALSPESYVWGQGWHFPRIPYEGAEFICLSHFGVTPNLEDLVQIYGYSDAEQKMPEPMHNQHDLDPASPIGMIDKCMPIQGQLAQAGYEFMSQGIMIDPKGKEVPVLRYRRPGSTSAPGVAVFYSEDRWRAYSHHGSDPLNNGHSNDAFDVFRILNGIDDTAEALRIAVPILQEYTAEELNQTYPSILEGGSKFRYGNLYTDETGASFYQMMDTTAFQAVMQNKPGVPDITTDEHGNQSIRMINRAEFWRTHRDRVLYNDMLYLPSPVLEEPKLTIEKGGKPYFNTFRGWHIKPRKGNWPLLEWHLKYAICGGNEQEYQYLLTWFAHLFKFPHEKPQVAIALRGGRGWGKSIVFSKIAQKLGRHALVVGNNKLLTGNFNGHMRDKLMLVVEESFWSGHHKDRGILQHIISDQMTSYEKKGFDAQTGLSFLRVVMISNEDWVVPAATDERRYFLPTLTRIAYDADVVNGRKGHYFPRLNLELEYGGMEAFIHDVAHMDLDPTEIRAVPQTEGLNEQKEMSLDWIDKWIMNVLDEGLIKSEQYGTFMWGKGGCVISNDALNDALKHYAPTSVLYSEKGLAAKLGRRLKDALGADLRKKRKGPEGILNIFKGIDVAKQRFEYYCGFPIEWGKGEIAGAESQINRSDHEHVH